MHYNYNMLTDQKRKKHPHTSTSSLSLWALIQQAQKIRPSLKKSAKKSGQKISTSLKKSAEYQLKKSDPLFKNQQKISLKISKKISSSIPQSETQLDSPALKYVFFFQFIALFLSKFEQNLFFLRQRKAYNSVTFAKEDMRWNEYLIVLFVL